MASNQLVPEKFLQPVVDSLPIRASGSWVSEKLHYVERYIYMFTTSMRYRPWRSRRFLDLFAGPGKCIVRENNEVVLGSPLIAVTTDHPFTDYVFVDAASENLEALKKRCEAGDLSANIHYFNGDANQLVDSIVEPIMEQDARYIPGQWWSLNLAFLDPDGLELEWNTVETLARVERMDLIIHYSQSGLTRNLDRCASLEEETIVDRFFGDRVWRRIHCEQRERGATDGSIHRALIDHYKSKLAELGYAEVKDQDFTTEPLIRNTRRNAPLYRLLFASKHELGNRFWKEVTKKDVYGQPRLL